MRHRGLWRRLAAASLVAASVVVFSQKPIRASEPPVDELNKLELKGTRALPLNQDRVSIVQSNGTRKIVPVVLEVATYEVTLSRVRNGSSVSLEPRPMYCFTLRSKDAAVAYSWSWWTDGPVGPVRLMRDGSSSYLAWVTGPAVFFANVSRPNAKIVRLSQNLDGHGNVPDVVSVPLNVVFPEVRNWGVNAFYNDITVRSIAKNKAGNCVVQFSGPKSDKIYTVVSDKSVPYGWRLRE